MFYEKNLMQLFETVNSSPKINQQMTMWYVVRSLTFKFSVIIQLRQYFSCEFISMDVLQTNSSKNKQFRHIFHNRKPRSINTTTHFRSSPKTDVTPTLSDYGTFSKKRKHLSRKNKNQNRCHSTDLTGANCPNLPSFSATQRAPTPKFVHALECPFLRFKSLVQFFTSINSPSIKDMTRWRLAKS